MKDPGKLRHRFAIQSRSVASTSDAGEQTYSWATDTTVWGSREADDIPSEGEQADHVTTMTSELVRMRYRSGMNASKRLLHLRDSSTLSAGINSSVTSLTIGAALKFEGANLDYIQIGTEVLRVTGGQTTTTLAVERGVLGTTAAAHSSGATVQRVQKFEIVGVQRVDEVAGEILLRVKRDG